MTTAEDAVAAVVALHPRYEGYPLRGQPRPDGSPGPVLGELIGQSQWVLARSVESGFELTFVTGSGDCPSGCIEHAYETFLVERDGSLTSICSGTVGPGTAGGSGRPVDAGFKACPDVAR